MSAWIGTCLQTRTISLKDAHTPQDVRATVFAGIDRFATEIAAACAEHKSDLVLLPEKALGDREEDLRGCLQFPGPEIERLQSVAQKHRVFIGANAYTLSTEFPGRYFNTSFLIDRTGAIVLKSYRLHTYHSSSPHDFWTAFVDKVGLAGAFPVARTELGNIAMLPSMEFMYPEIARAFVLRGAEVLLHTTMEKIVDRSTKRTRAAENMAYVLSANLDSHIGPDAFMDVSSLIVDFRGRVLAEKQQGTAGTCSAAIDIYALRQRRADPDITFPAYSVNYLSRLRTEIAATAYAAQTIYPGDTYKGEVVRSAISPVTGNTEKLHAALRNMTQAGMLPGDYRKGG